MGVPELAVAHGRGLEGAAGTEPGTNGPPGLLPNFLCIGCPRCGTTWLHELLATHPNVVVPTALKEIHYFDKHYDRGEGWYRRFFVAPGRDAESVKAIGEATPHYIYGRGCAERIRGMASVQKLIVMVRDPVARAYSHYRWRRARRGYPKSFEDLLREDEAALRWGMYGTHLAPFIDLFGRDQILVLVQEQTSGRAVETRERIAAFLGIDAARFPPAAGQRAVNTGFEPRFPGATAWMIGAGRGLRSLGLDRLVNAGKQLAARYLYADGRAGPVDSGMLPATEASLRELYASDIALLERLMGLDLGAWKSVHGVGGGMAGARGRTQEDC